MSSNLLLIFLIIGVVAMVVGPIMMMQPNAVQRRQETLRTRAMTLGLRVKMGSLLQSVHAARETLPIYWLPLLDGNGQRQWLLIREAYSHESHFLDYWSWYDKQKASEAEQHWLRENLPYLPDSIKAIAADPQGINVYWSEMEGERGLESIAHFLTSYADFQN